MNSPFGFGGFGEVEDYVVRVSPMAATGSFPVTAVGDSYDNLPAVRFVGDSSDNRVVVARSFDGDYVGARVFAGSTFYDFQFIEGDGLPIYADLGGQAGDEFVIDNVGVGRFGDAFTIIPDQGPGQVNIVDGSASIDAINLVSQWLDPYNDDRPTFLVGGSLSTDSPDSRVLFYLGRPTPLPTQALVRLGGLTLVENAQAVLSGPADQVWEIVGDADDNSRSGLAMHGTTRLNVTDQVVVLSSGIDNQSNLGLVENELADGYNNGDWTGTGILSTDAGGNVSIGYGRAEDTQLDEELQLFASPPDYVFLGLTVVGDANGDRTTNLSDFLLLRAGFGTTNTGLLGGDFNFDGETNLTDFLLLRS
ncbi:MAG: dockerin type I domain-containing protein, partial [Planctomycetota bacterium]